jgi:hypothetical protein
MDTIDTLIARTQRNITYLYCVLFAAVLAVLILLPKPLDQATNTLLISLLSVLGLLITQQSNFWFARSRTAGVPDPITTTSTTTTPTPIGVSTNVTTTTPTAVPVLSPPAAGA